MRIAFILAASLAVLLPTACSKPARIPDQPGKIRLKIPHEPVAVYSQQEIMGGPPGRYFLARDSFKAKSWGFINEYGAVVIPPEWKAAGIFHEDRASVLQDGKWGFIDPSGNMAIQPIYDDMTWGTDDLAPKFADGFARIQKDHSQLLVDKDGKLSPDEGKAALPSKLDSISLKTSSWDWIGGFFGSPIRVRKGEQCGFIDYTGKVLIEPQYFNAGDFHEGLAGFQMHQDSKWGFINVAGKVAIEPQWHGAGDFSEGLAWVENNEGLFGFIDKTGKEVIPCVWKSIGYEFSHGLITVTSPKYQEGAIDSTGRVMVQPEWDQAASYNGYIFAERILDPSKVPTSSPDASYHGSFPAEAAWFDRTGKMIWHTP